MRLYLLTLLAAIYISFKVHAQLVNTVTCMVNGTAQLPLPQSANYRRLVKDADFKESEQIFRVCTGKNKAKCGFWEDIKTKKKVASGKTTYNKNKKVLVIKQAMKIDSGTYMTGNKKATKELKVLIMKGK